MVETAVGAGPGRRGVRAAGLLIVLLVALGCGRPATEPPAAAPGPSPASAPATPPPGSSPPADGTAPADEEFDHEPLWPFADASQVSQWQEAYRTGGHQPWHLDAGQTALAFTQGYLDFAGIDRVTSTTMSGDDTWVGVGFALPDGRETTAAVVHLARFGSGEDAPWEVVGTRDDTLTLDVPRHGDTVTSPVTVGGTITGVDESLRVQVRGLESEAPLGESCCLPAGGERSAWSAGVAFTGATGATLTIVVSTGGHIADVERFAITGVRAG